MNRICAAICTAILAVPSIATAADASGCDSVNISQDVMTKFPKIRSVCQTVKTKEGGIYILFIGEVTEATKSDVTVRIKDRDGKDAADLKLGFAAGQQIKVQGKEMNFADLKKGDKLDFWIEHSKWGLFAKPGSSAVTVISKTEL
jgi:hypothetical protein